MYFYVALIDKYFSVSKYFHPAKMVIPPYNHRIIEFTYCIISIEGMFWCQIATLKKLEIIRNKTVLYELPFVDMIDDLLVVDSASSLALSTCWLMTNHYLHFVYVLILVQTS